MSEYESWWKVFGITTLVIVGGALVIGVCGIVLATLKALIGAFL